MSARLKSATADGNSASLTNRESVSNVEIANTPTPAATGVASEASTPTSVNGIVPAARRHRHGDDAVVGETKREERLFEQRQAHQPTPQDVWQGEKLWVVSV
jgi:hypothetical protein